MTRSPYQNPRRHAEPFAPVHAEPFAPVHAAPASAAPAASAAMPAPPASAAQMGMFGAVPGMQMGMIRAVPGAPMYRFTGGAASFLGVQILGILVTVFTLGICYPWAVTMRYSWQARHTYLFGHRLHFTGRAIGLFGNWVKWLLLIIVTLGIYSFWVYPRMTKWIVEHQRFADPAAAFG